MKSCTPTCARASIIDPPFSIEIKMSLDDVLKKKKNYVQKFNRPARIMYLDEKINNKSFWFVVLQVLLFRVNSMLMIIFSPDYILTII